jgi:hypothetical protein
MIKCRKTPNFLAGVLIALVLISCGPAAISPGSTANVTGGGPVTVSPGKVEVRANRADIDFPDKVTFTLDASSSSPITGISLEYSTDKRTIARETARVEPKYTPGEKISASWSLEMKKSGSLPPGAAITWQWKTVDKAGAVFTTPARTLQYTDTRFSWKSRPGAMVDYFWYSQTESMMNTMTGGLETRMANIKLPVDFGQGRKPKIFLYANSSEIKEAVLFQREWVGALAYPDYNIILIPCSVEMLSWCSTALAHEITHLIVGETVYGPFGDLPTWLNEGLARYSEGDMPDYDRQVLKDAVKSGKTISVRSLSGTFPTDTAGANLAYAESGSIVTYMIKTYGWEKMQALLSVFKEGSTNDNALRQVFMIDTSTLEKQWLEWAKQ